MESDSVINTCSVSDEITNLEAKLKSLNLETVEAPAGVGVAVAQNDLRISLKSIGVALQGNKKDVFSDIARVHGILRKPLELDASLQNGNDVGSVLSYLKLLSELSLPSPHGSGEESNGVSDDIFWKHVLEPVVVDIFSYMNVHVFEKSFTTFLSSSSGSEGGEIDSETPSSQGTGFAFHHQLGILLKGIRILLVYLKRAILSLRKGHPGTDSLKKSVKESLTILSSLMNPLASTNNRLDFDIGLDIRCNIGIAICYSMYYLSYPNDEQIRSFFNTIFHEKPEHELWSILQLGSSDTNRIALAFGVLNTWLDQQYDKDLYYGIAENVLNTEHGVKEAVNLGSARVLEIWAEKLSRDVIPIEVLKHVSPLFASLEFFCFMYMPAHIDAVKNCCKNILSSLTQIYDRLDEEKFPAIGASTWVASILSSILRNPPHIKWAGLTCVIRNTKKSLMLLDMVPSLPDQLLITQRNYKSTVSDAYVALMSYHFEKAPSAETWEKTWIDPLFRAQISQHNESNWPQKKNIISMILNSEKLRAAQYKNMILPLLKSVLKRMNSGQNSSLCDSDNEKAINTAEITLLAAETIKMAYELKISVDPQQLHLERVRDSSSAPEDSFRGLVPRSVLNNWLWNENPQIRLAGFALLVETKKTSDVISKQDFESLKLFFKHNLMSQNPAFRQQFMSYFKKFVRRLKDGESVSRRKKDTETVQSYQNFLRWLWQFLAEEEGLFIGANFARRCQALECLSELTEAFPNGFEVFGLTAAGNTKYLRWLTDTYENNKIQALEILCRMPMEEFASETFCANLYNEAMSLCKSVKPPDSVTGRYLMTLLMRKAATQQEYSPLKILGSLYDELESLLKKVEVTSLVQVSSESPLYGCVRCIRMVIGNTNEYREEGYAQKYREYVAKLLKLCFAVDNVLFPVLGSAAPEGFLPELKDSNAEENSQVVRSLAAQMLLVCAWRSMKEVCLLMSDMCCWFVMEGESNLPSVKKNNLVVTDCVDYLLTFDQVSAIGDHLLYLLTNLMHRGVFEQVFVGFKQLATRLWKSTAPKLSNLPEKWLQQAMNQEQISSKSITRRSAGLPFIFQALLSAENDNEAFLQKWVQRLLVFDESPEMAPIRIHSMNVLRGLFRDACFAAAMMPFVPHGLKLAFRGLKSLDWTERNSGLMLYGAVMRRTFGPKLNLMNATTFFRKFPQMYDFLLNELDTCVQTMEKRKREQTVIRSKVKEVIKAQEGIPMTHDFTFHLLLLLSSFTASGRVEDTHFKLADFIPRIRKCSASDDMEVRKLAAKALIPFLTSPEDKQELAVIVLREICIAVQISQNELHGLLLQFLTITSHIPKSNEDPCDVGKLVQEFLSHVTSSKTFLSSRTSPTICETLMEILVNLGAIKSQQNSRLYMRAVEFCLEIFRRSFEKNSSARNIVPGLPVADKTVANCLIKIFAKELKRESVLERIYEYFVDSLVKSKPFVNQFLELMEDDAEISSKFTEYLFATGEEDAEAMVVIEAVISNYLRRVADEFIKFPGTDTELYYLNLMGKIPAEMLEGLELNVLLPELIQRLFYLCDGDSDKESTTLQIKAAALMVLGNIAFSTSIDLSNDHKTRLCDIAMQWSTSDVDDDMRCAVATSIPKIPFPNMTRLSATNQAKLWSSILMLAQDDESFLREIISRKLRDTCNNACCDRKSLEVVMHVFTREFLIPNPIEGLLVLIGLLMREDFEVEAKAADDETEDRLFDKSEMNMFFEHQILAKTIREEMKASKVFENESVRFSLNGALLERQINFFNVLVNKSVEYDAGKELSIKSIVSGNDSGKYKQSSAVSANKLGELFRSSSSDVKCFVQEFLEDFVLET